MKYKNIFSVSILRMYALFISFFFILNGAVAAEASSQQRTPSAYLEATKGQERILLIGNGHRAGIAYPQNYFLVDIDKDKQPDFVADITKLGSLPEGFLGLFDIVIWERVDVKHFASPNTLPNIHALLKSEGHIISNMLVDVQLKSMLHQTKFIQLLVLEQGIEYFSPETEKLPIPFLCYVSDMIAHDNDLKNQAKQKCFNSIFKPWLESKGGFKNIQHLSTTPYWKNSPVHDGYISIQKK